MKPSFNVAYQHADRGIYTITKRPEGMIHHRVTKPRDFEPNNRTMIHSQHRNRNIRSRMLKTRSPFVIATDSFVGWDRCDSGTKFETGSSRCDILWPRRKCHLHLFSGVLLVDCTWLLKLLSRMLHAGAWSYTWLDGIRPCSVMLNRKIY